MANGTTLPYSKLVAYDVARELVVAVRAAKISDSKLRDQALRAGTSACLNIAEAAGRVSAADKSRVYGIARGEASEACAAVDVAAAAGWCSEEAARTVEALGNKLFALLTGLFRARSGLGGAPD